MQLKSLPLGRSRKTILARYEYSTPHKALAFCVFMLTQVVRTGSGPLNYWLALLQRLLTVFLLLTKGPPTTLWLPLQRPDHPMMHATPGDQ